MILKNLDYNTNLPYTSKEIAPDLREAVRKCMRENNLTDNDISVLLEEHMADRYRDLTTSQQLAIAAVHEASFKVKDMSWNTYCFFMALLGYHRVSVGAFTPGEA